MTDLDARKTTRRTTWITVIVTAVLTLNAARHAVFDTEPGFRFVEGVFAILGLVIVVWGCRELIRSKRP